MYAQKYKSMSGNRLGQKCEAFRGSMIVFKKNPNKPNNTLMRKDSIITEVFIFNLKWIREHSECKCCTLRSDDISAMYTAYCFSSLSTSYGSFSAASSISTVIKASLCNKLTSVNAILY